MKKRPESASWRALHDLLRPCRRLSVILSFTAALQSLLLVFLALAARGVINGALEDTGKLAAWCAVLLALAIGIPVLRGLVNGYAGRATDRVSARLRQNVLDLLQRKDCESINGYHSGHLYSRLMNDCWSVCERYTGLIPTVAGQVFQLAAAVVVLAALQAGLTAAVLAAGVLAAAGGLMFRRLLKTRHLAVRRAEEQLTACAQESLEHMETLRSVVAEGEVSRRFDQRQAGWLKARTALRRLSVGGNAVFSMAVQLASAAIILWGALAIRGGRMSFGDMTAILQLVSLFRSPVTGLTGIQSRLASADAAEERLLELWDLPEEPAGEPPTEDAVCKALIFRNVTFSYAGEERPVLRNFSARVELDRWTCLMGVSGRGKSTLYRLILGLFRPNEGEILLETDRGNVPCSAATRSLFSFVPQSPILFSGTLRENLLLAKPDATEEELWSVLERAECTFVRELPRGLDTVLGESGMGLSIGQRQRVAIARALLGKAQVLLLDEITASLDRETETRLLACLARTCPAALIATHRPDALAEIRPDRLDLGDLAPEDAGES